MDALNYKREYVILTSRDEYDFFLEKEIANHSDEIARLIKVSAYEGKHKRVRLPNIKGHVLEVVVQYLHYKAKHNKAGFEKLALQFQIQPEIALDVLKAGIELRL